MFEIKQDPVFDQYKPNSFYRRIDGTHEDEVKEILFHTIENQPGLIFAMIKQDSGPVTLNKNTDVPSWWGCGHCW